MTFALEQASTQESFSSIQSHSSLLISANTVLLLWDENKHYRCSKRAVIDQLPYYAITFIITAHDRDTLLKYSKYKQPDYLVFFNLQVTWHLKQQRQKIERLTLCLVTQSCPALCNPTDCSPPGSSVHGDSPGTNTGVGSHSLLQGIFPTQGSNPRL